MSIKHVTRPTTKDAAEVIVTLYSFTSLVHNADGNDQIELKTTVSEIKLHSIENPTAMLEGDIFSQKA